MGTELIIAIVLVVLSAFAALLAFGSFRMHRLVKDGRGMIICDIKGASASTTAIRVPPSATVPTPVSRYLEMSGAMRGHPVSLVHLRQTGTIRLSEKSGWSKMLAEQWFSGLFPAFVWHAVAKPFPILWAEARDSLLRGKGRMIIRLLSLFTIADAQGPELDISSLVRYGSEMPWFPSAMKPSASVIWEEIDNISARMILRERGLSASMVFTFNDKGEITRLDTEDRYRDTHRKQPWIVRYGSYREFDGYRIPTEGEAAWKTAGGEFVYIRLRITEIQYQRRDS